MRLVRSLAPLLALALYVAQAHAAAGVSLRWNTCYGDGGVQNKNFACDTNDGSETLVGSFTLLAYVVQSSGNEIVLDLAFAGATVPQWWSFKNAGACRLTSLTFGYAPQGACVGWAPGGPAGGIGAYAIGTRGPNTARLVAVLAVPSTALEDLVAGQEYFSFSLTIDHLKTVGAGSCSGCSTPACLVLKSIRVTTQVPANNVLLQGPANGVDSDWATWQGGGGVTVGGATGCPAATPTAKRTWSAVKALYH